MFEELKKRLEKVINLLEEGGVLATKYVINQYGEKISDDIIIYDKETGEIRLRGIACFSSSDLGLGTCLCNTHDPWFEEEISFDKFVSAIRDYLIEGLEIDLKHLNNKNKVQKLKNVLSEVLNIVEKETDIDTVIAKIAKLKHI